jgi:hypothetical protein
MTQANNRALVVLAAFDYESLQLTLFALDHTVDPSEKIVVILNGKRNFASERVERMAREWASHRSATRFVVRPLCAGQLAWFGLTEIIAGYEPLKNVDYICKIDDDIIPLKKGWLNNLADTYHLLEKEKKMGFTTGLINNNSWGFAELVNLFGKKAEYDGMYNYQTKAGEFEERLVPPYSIDSGLNGTVLQYPYLGWWIHQWTSNNIPAFLQKTAALSPTRIPDNTHYSIGCIYFEKALWLSIDLKNYKSKFDELLIQVKSREEGREKWAVMSEPMIHLFYRTQRIANRDIVAPIAQSLAAHFGDERFRKIEHIDSDHFGILANEGLGEMETKINYLHRKVSTFGKIKLKSKLKKIFTGK